MPFGLIGSQYGVVASAHRERCEATTSRGTTVGGRREWSGREPGWRVLAHPDCHLHRRISPPDGICHRYTLNLSRSMLELALPISSIVIQNSRPRCPLCQSQSTDTSPSGPYTLAPVGVGRNFASISRHAKRSPFRCRDTRTRVLGCASCRMFLGRPRASRYPIRSARSLTPQLTPSRDRSRSCPFRRR